MTYLILFIYSIIFVELFIGFRLVRDINGVLQLTGESLNVMRSKSMNDRDKEQFMRTNSLTMIRRTLNFIGKFLAIFALIFLLNYLLAIISAEESAAVMASITSLKIILIVTLVTIIYVWVRNVVQKKL